MSTCDKPEKNRHKSTYQKEFPTLTIHCDKNISKIVVNMPQVDYICT